MSLASPDAKYAACRCALRCSLGCATCKSGFGPSEDKLSCIACNSIAECKTYVTNACQCQACQPGYQLSEDKWYCGPCPYVANCAAMNANPCLGCNTCERRQLRWREAGCMRARGLACCRGWPAPWRPA